MVLTVFACVADDLGSHDELGVFQGGTGVGEGSVKGA